MAAITSPESSAQPRVYFQTPPGTEEEVPQKQGRVTVKYDRKELRRRLNLEEWIVSQLMTLYDCEVGMNRFTEQHHSDTVCILCCKDSVLSRVLSHCLLVVSNSHPDVSLFVYITRNIVFSLTICDIIIILPAVWFGATWKGVATSNSRQSHKTKVTMQEDEVPELEIDVDELLDLPSDVERAIRVKMLLVDCYKPNDDFVAALLEKVRGMQKLNTPQKKGDITP